MFLAPGTGLGEISLWAAWRGTRLLRSTGDNDPRDADFWAVAVPGAKTRKGTRDYYRAVEEKFEKNRRGLSRAPLSPAPRIQNRDMDEFIYPDSIPASKLTRMSVNETLALMSYGEEQQLLRKIRNREGRIEAARKRGLL